MAYDDAAFKLRGDLARLNFPHRSHGCLPAAIDAKLQAISQPKTVPAETESFSLDIRGLDEQEGLLLRKCPSWEIDWDVILSSS